MLHSEQCSLQQSPEQIQMPAKFFSGAQLDIFTCESNIIQKEEQVSSKQGICGQESLQGQAQQLDSGISSTTVAQPISSIAAGSCTSEPPPSVVLTCPTNWHQIPLEQAQSEELHSSSDTYQSLALDDEYDGQHRQEQEECSKPQDNEKTVTKGENALVQDVHKSLGPHDKILQPPPAIPQFSPALPTFPSQIECTVNQESYEHQPGHVRRSSLSQPSKVQGGSLQQAPNKTNGIYMPSNVTAIASSTSRDFPAQGSHPLREKVPLYHASPQMQNGVNNTSLPAISRQATGPQLNIPKQVGKSMLPVTSSMPTGTVNYQRASTLEARSATMSSTYAMSNLSERFQAQVPNNLPGVSGLAAQKKVGESILSIQPPSKKQKLDGDSFGQSFDQINDVTVVSGVNLKEEEEQLLAEPTEKSRASEALKRFVQEEELKLFLEKRPLHQKIVGIASMFGIESVSEDVERCLSLSIEEWFQNILYKATRFSKQRYDLEKRRQNVVVTSDTRQKIVSIKERAKEVKGSIEALGQKQTDGPSKQSEEKEKAIEDKEKPKLKGKKLHKDDDKVRVQATNIAARKALGADDMLIKWQIMAEQARLKRTGEAGGSERVATDQASKFSGVNGRGELERMHMSKNAAAESVTTPKKSNSGMPTLTTDTGRPPGSMPNVPSRSRLITVKDLIAVLEMEPQLAKSTLLYRLYDRIPWNSS